MFNFVLCCFICLVNEALYKIVSACVDPVRFRLCIRILFRTIYKVYNIPGTINIRFSKTVAIIPVLYFCELIFQIIIRKQLSHFCICKTELLIETSICDGEDFEVVESRKDTFL